MSGEAAYALSRNAQVSRDRYFTFYLHADAQRQVVERKPRVYANPMLPERAGLTQGYEAVAGRTAASVSTALDISTNADSMLSPPRHIRTHMQVNCGCPIMQLLVPP